jgi:hypothetical protein
MLYAQQFLWRGCPDLTILGTASVASTRGGLCFAELGMTEEALILVEAVLRAP